jgi:hypothetical protein
MAMGMGEANGAEREQQSPTAQVILGLVIATEMQALNPFPKQELDKTIIKIKNKFQI